MTKTEKAVLDRIVDGKFAVLMVGEDERQVEYPAEGLPSGARAGVWMKAETEGDTIVSLEIDEVNTEEIAQRIHGKLEQLRRQGRKTQ